ncbi:hypothetical protein GCM10010435_41770 [Winogradskya consettensis]|uniref:Uncharacterized protein n=1 Tax=Winogradskya consettensis TaxID=113560 RepID=A0A919SRU7_9ACTN|nr:hypothetical protein Aco04nite_52110 [Actinoplanes consettensis]
MNVLRRMLCSIGLHAGQWFLPGSRCESQRVCTVCGKLSEKVRHSWTEFAYVAAGGCEQVRRCERCSATESRPEHDWGPWFYTNMEFSAPQAHRCRRCHQTEKTIYTMR